MTEMMASDENCDSYLMHYGVLGMKWGVRKQKPENPVKKELKSYRTDKGPMQSKHVNAGNSAARAHYRAQRTRDFQVYRKKLESRDLKEAPLTRKQIQNGRYRVARARNIKRTIASTAISAVAGTAAVASGAAVAGALIAGVGTVAMRKITGANYYSKQSKLYGKRRAQLQSQPQVKKRKEAL